MSRPWMRHGLRSDWLAQVHEEAIDPGQVIVDPHHHLFASPNMTYEVEALWSDTEGAGHNVVQTVFVECGAYYDTDAPDGFAPVGETRKVAEFAAQTALHPDRAQIAGIVAHADLRRSDLDAVLDAHEAAGAGLLRGIRHAGACDPEPAALEIAGRAPAGLYLDEGFRRGLARLGARGLTYDTWHYHHQNRDFIDLARAVPDTTLVLDHFGTPLGVGRFAGQRAAIFDAWRAEMEDLSACPNVIAKLGGLAMPDNGWGWHQNPVPPGSDEVHAAHAPWYEHMIGCFGPERCMFESNFPVDRLSVGYGVLWNALKKIAAPWDADARDAMFFGTARRIYRL